MARPVIAYCDGSAHAGFGGVGVVWVWGQRTREYSVGFRGEEDPLVVAGIGEIPPGVTNQRMELMAAIVALMLLSGRWQGKPVVIRSDSAYLVNCFLEGWLETWRGNDWKTYGGSDVKNRVFWETLETWVTLFEPVTFEHVKGHAGHRYNERADALARRARKEIAGKR